MSTLHGCGVVARRNSRGPRETDPDSKDRMYSYYYDFYLKKQEHNKLTLGPAGRQGNTRLLDNKQKQRAQAHNELTKTARGQPRDKEHKHARTIDCDLSNCVSDVQAVRDKEEGDQGKTGEDPRKQEAAAQHDMFDLYTPKPPNVTGRGGGGGVNGGDFGSAQRQSVMLNFFIPTPPNVAGAAGRDGADGVGNESGKVSGWSRDQVQVIDNADCDDEDAASSAAHHSHVRSLFL